MNHTYLYPQPMGYKTLLFTLVFWVLIGCATAVAAQQDSIACAESGWLELDGISGTMTDFARLAEITGRAEPRPRLIRRPSKDLQVPVCEDVPWQARLMQPTVDGARQGPSLRVLPARSAAVVNTGFPNDRNNGALWAGRGLSAEVAGGLALQWGPVSAALAPAVLYQQNAGFIESPWREIDGIDWPQRFGTRSFASLEPGQSFLRVDTHGVAAGISTENVWLGPGISNSILLSNTAPGFTHAFLGTSEPLDIYIADLEMEVLYGNLGQSPFFENQAAVDDRLLAALVFNLEPRWLPGLYLGGARVFHQNIDDTTLWFPFVHGFFGSGERDELDQLVALYGRWVLPESGFEAFVEWARTDGSADLHGAITELDHSAAYVIGFQKVQEIDPGWLRIQGEVTSLNPRLPAFRHSAGGYYYTHGVVRQGYTHRGQLLGASIGRGSDAQLLGLDLLTGWGSGGMFVERVRRSVDTFFRTTNLRQANPFRFDVELNVGGRAAYFLGDLRADMGLSYSHRRSRDFLPPDPEDLERGYRVDSNWNLQLDLSWQPGLEIWRPFERSGAPATAPENR